MLRASILNPHPLSIVAGLSWLRYFDSSNWGPKTVKHRMGYPLWNIDILRATSKKQTPAAISIMPIQWSPETDATPHLLASVHRAGKTSQTKPRKVECSLNLESTDHAISCLKPYQLMPETLPAFEITWLSGSKVIRFHQQATWWPFFAWITSIILLGVRRAPLKWFRLPIPSKSCDSTFTDASQKDSPIRSIVLESGPAE